MKRICAALVAVFAIALSLSAQAPASGPAVIKSVGFVKSDAGLEISVQIAGTFEHKTFVLSSPNRLVIDVSPAQRIEARPAYDVQAFGVTAIRTGQFKRRVSRIILDFSGPIPSYDVQKTESGLLVKIAGAPAAAEKAPAPAVSPEPVGKGQPVEPVKPAPKEGAPAPAAEAAEPKFYNTTAGIMIGTYSNEGGRFGEVYGTGTSIQFGLNLSRTLLYYRGFHLDASAEARLISRTGQATLSGDETKISIYPLSLAAVLAYDTKYVIPFVGYGGDWYNYSEKSALANTTGSATGDHFQGGLFIVIPGMENLRVKLYYKYTRVTAVKNEIEVELGGPEYGIGVSYGFNFLNKALLVF